MTPSLVSSLVPSFVKRRYTAKFVVSILFVLLAIGIVGYVGYAQISTIENDVEGDIAESTEGDLRTGAFLQANSINEWTGSMSYQARLVGQLPSVSGGDSNDARTRLIDYGPTLQGYSSIHVVDVERNRVVASTASGTAVSAGTSFGDVDEPWARGNLSEDLTGGQVWISDGAYESVAVDGQRVVAFVAPARNASRAVVVTSSIINRVQRVTEGNNDLTTQVLNEEGEFALQGNNEGELNVDEQELEAVQRSLGENNVTFTDHGETLQAYAPVGGTGQAGEWVAVTSTPKEQAYALRDQVGQDVRSSTGQLLLAIVAVAFLSLGIMGFVLGRQTVTPLRRLRTKAQSMEEGDLSVDLETGRTDEIGQLYSAFGSMRDSLREQIEEAQSAREEAEAERERIQQINEEIETAADEYSGVMQRAADGDLTARMEASAENEAMAAIAEEFNEMLAEIEETIEELNAFAAEVATASEQVTASSEEVRSASEQISESVQEISAGAERQNDSLQSVNQEMSDLSTTTEEIAASSNEVADIAERTAETGKEGRDAAQAAIESMREVQDESSQAVAEIGQLEQEVGQIDELIERIQEISDQTNMLALNANIEASRSTSGEGDGGFGVVAQEVKELSQDAKEAAEEIENRLESIREQTRRSAEEVERTSDDVDEASEQVADAVDALEEIAEYAGETNTGVQEISAATEEQAASTQEVVAMVDEAATISEETTAESESVAAAAEEQTTALTEVSNSASDLSEQAARLSEALDRFDTDAELEGAETRMLEDDQSSETAGVPTDDAADIDDFEPDVPADEFGAAGAVDPEGGADESAPSPAGEPEEAGPDGAPAEQAADAGEDAPDEPGDGPSNDAPDATGDDVFEFGATGDADAGPPATEDESIADAGEPVDDGDELTDGQVSDAGADAEDRPLTDVSGIGDTKAESLRAAGYGSVADLQAATQAELAQVDGIGDALAVEIKDDVGHK